MVGQFYLDGEKDKFASRFVSGNVLTLKQEEASATQKITYIKEVTCSQDNRLIGANGRRADLLRGPAPVRRGVPLTEVGHDNFIVAIGPKKVRIPTNK